ncbi:MAG: PEGA domain-containing protein [Trueperaceae bacterium]|nr:PEGA domain-containing protein [Trueperaceae bacterium]
MTHLNALVKQAHRFLSLLLIPLLLNLTSCALLINGTGQMVPVTSSPVGVEVYLDGEFKGITPLELEISRGQSHELLLRYGEQEKLIMLETEIDYSTIAADAVPAVLGAILTLVLELTVCQEGYCGAGLVLGGAYLFLPSAGVSGILVGIDTATGAIYTLSPPEINESFGPTQP